jgi:hypothetical protein
MSKFCQTETLLEFAMIYTWPLSGLLLLEFATSPLPKENQNQKEEEEEEEDAKTEQQLI